MNQPIDNIEKDASRGQVIPLPRYVTDGRLLEWVSLVYFFLPTLLFVLGWIRWPIALPIVGLVVAAWFTPSVRPGANNVSMPESITLSDRRRFVALFALVLFIVACSGIGGFTYQFFDYTMYDAQLRDLAQANWPLAWEIPGDDKPFIGPYYYGYYLPAALVGKVFGWYASNFFSYFWAVMGTFLAALWLLRILRTKNVLLALPFLFFGGLDILGHLLTAPLPPAHDLGWWDYFTGTYWWSTGRGWLDHWTANLALLSPEGMETLRGVFYRFYSPLSFLSDGPQHVIPSWVILFMIFDDLVRKESNRRVFFLAAALPISSLFVAIGALPFLIHSLYRIGLRSAVTFANVVAGPALVLCLGLYFMSNTGTLIHGWLWRYQDMGQAWPYLLLYYLVEFGIYALVAPSIRHVSGHPGKGWLRIALLVFILAPWYRLGEFNDLATKVIIPAQLMFIVCLVASMRLNADAPASARVRRNALIALVIVGALAPLGVLLRAVQFGFSATPPPLSQVRHGQERLPHELLYKVQANRESPFWKWLAKTPDIIPLDPIPVSYSWDFRTGEALKDWYYFEHDRKLSAAGVWVTASFNSPLVRELEVEVDTRRVGTVELDHEVWFEGAPIEDYMLIFQWADGDAVKKNDNWPFHRWLTDVLHPQEYSVSSNSYWRGEVATMVLYLQDTHDPPRTGEVRVLLKELRMLER